MKLNLVYFGAVAEAVGVQAEEIEVDDNSNLEQLRSKLEESYPDLEHLQYNIAVNQAIEESHSALYDKDELAFLPPFAGG